MSNVSIKHKIKSVYYSLYLTGEYSFLENSIDNEDTFILGYLNGSIDTKTELLLTLAEKDNEIADLKKQIAIIVEDRENEID